MKFEVCYGNERLPVSIASSNVSVLYPGEVTAGNEHDILSHALEHPIDAQPLEKFLEHAHDILIIVNDQTRPTPTGKVLSSLHDTISKKNTRFIVATGVHTLVDGVELTAIFEKYYKKWKNKIIIHNARHKEDMVYCGTTRHGTELWLNRLAVEADKIISISSVEPHYFAGYTGGRKSFLPGIAGYTTIEQNHKFALNPLARAFSLQGNPVHEDMVDAVTALKEERIFTIQTVLDRNHRIHKVFTGHIHGAFEKAIEYARKIYGAKIQEKADIVVTVAQPPFDIDLYQTLKAIQNGALALKKGGILLVISQCRNGIGPEHFARLADGKTFRQAVKESIKRYKLGDHIAVNLMHITSTAELWTVTDITDKKLQNIRMKPFKSVQQALDSALRRKGTNAKVLILMNGGLTVPLPA